MNNPARPADPPLSLAYSIFPGIRQPINEKMNDFLGGREGAEKLRRLEAFADDVEGMGGEHLVEFPHDPRRGFEPAYLVHLHPERMIIEPDSARRQFHLRLA